MSGQIPNFNKSKMKFQFKKIIAVMAITTVFASCSNDDTYSDLTNQYGNLEVEFDNVFGNANLILDSQSNVTSQGETMNISNVKYVISNIVLIKEDGSTFVYPKVESYFIVSEANEVSRVLELGNIPAGNYTAIRFGIGVDEAQYDLGEAGQGGLFVLAQNEGMASVWSEGYKHLLLEGTFTSSTVASPTAFIVNTGKSATAYNYTQVTLDFPDKALVRSTITPDVHIFADVAKVIDGTNKINLSANIAGGSGSMITSGENMSLVTANLSQMFTVDHVHND
jgi:hypothetical protein